MAPDQNNGAPTLTKQMLNEWRTGGDLLAKSLALALNDPAVGEAVINMVDSSEHGELFLADLLELPVTLTASSGTLRAGEEESLQTILASRLNQTSAQFNQIIEDASPVHVEGDGDWVLGLTVPTEWAQGEPAIVMLDPWWIDEKNVTLGDLYAYDLSGEVVFLEQEASQDLPTIGITPLRTCGQNCGGGGGGGTNGNPNFWIDKTIYYHNSESYSGSQPQFNVRLKRSGVGGGWQKTYIGYIKEGSPGCTNPNTFTNDLLIGTGILRNEIYHFKLYEDDKWPNPDDLCMQHDIDMSDLGIGNRQLFTDGTNCTTQKQCDFYLYLKNE